MTDSAVIVEAVFDEPWQAQALALSVALQDAGLVTPQQWAQALGTERARAGLRDDGRDYYHSVVTAVERVLADAGLSSGTEIDQFSAAWGRAALATPHGKPIVLDNDPQRRAG